MNAVFELYTQVVLRKDVPEWNLRKGDVATLVDKHPGPPGEEDGYSLETFNVNGESFAIISLAANEIASPNENGVFQVRK